MTRDPLGTLKKIREIIKKYHDRELMKMILALQTELFELHSDILNLDAELASLRRQLDAHKKMQMRPTFNQALEFGGTVGFVNKPIGKRPSTRDEQAPQRCFRPVRPSDKADSRRTQKCPSLPSRN
jgi:hypothetical protein